jgi:hypothetical protein
MGLPFLPEGWKSRGNKKRSGKCQGLIKKKVSEKSGNLIRENCHYSKELDTHDHDLFNLL